MHAVIGQCLRSVQGCKENMIDASGNGPEGGKRRSTRHLIAL